MLLDPAQALIESDKLGTSADDCQAIMNEISQLIEELPAFWEGVSANMFIQNNLQVIESLKGIKSEMLQISDEIKVLAMTPQVM